MTWQGCATILIALIALATMASGRSSPHWVMLAVMIVLSSTGIISTEQALAGFSNTALMTVAALFVVAAGIHNAGGVDVLVHRFLGRPASIRHAQARIIFPVALLSGFMNNTPVVATLIPAIHVWCRRIGIAPSKLMIPLSYAAILGGTLTLMGTSTNLVVNGLYRELTGDVSLSLFSITAIGLPVALVGLVAIVCVFPRILPERQDAQKFGSLREFTLEVRVDPSGPLVGKTVDAAGLRNLDRLYLVEIERQGSVVTAVPSEERIMAGDRLVFAGETQAISDLLRIQGIVPSTHDNEPSLDQHRAERRLVEAALSPRSDVIGQTIRDARFRDRFGAVVLAVARHGRRVQGNLGNIRLQAGDVLLLEARPAFVSRQHYAQDFLLINDLDTERPRHDKASLAWLILVGVVFSATFGVLSILNAALLGASAMIVTGCLRVGQIQKSLDAPVLLTIAASFALGNALQSTGAAAVIAQWLVSLSGGDTLLMLIMVYLTVSVLTEVITNNAAAVVMVPIVLSITSAAQVNAEPFIMAVMMAASASFATPLGYQTNLMVMGPGGYRFSDYLKVGLPMNLLIGITTLVVITIRYELH